MRLVHTSDWHLGHALHGVARDHEHARFLAWLEQVLVEERPHALLITGDVFDTATPSAAAERALFDFLARARAADPGLDIIIIGGNHDSAPRLEAPASLLRALGVHVVASLQRRPGRPLDLERLVVPLRGAGGEVAAWLAVVPFLRPADLPPAHVAQDPLAAVRAVYDEVLAHARARRAPGQALLATGHLTLTGAEASAESERPVLGGLTALTDDLFAPDLAYVALGHLHRAQAVGGREGVRYAGSPIPLSMTEAGYAHQVVVVDVEGEALAAVRPRLVPRTLDLLRLPGPDEPPATLEAALERLRALPDGPPPAPGQPDQRPLLEVRVAAAAPEPGLRRRVEDALQGKAARLVKLALVAPATDDAPRALADAAPHARLSDLSPREVFERCWRREHDDAAPPPEVAAAFDDLLASVQRPASAADAPIAVDRVAALTGGDAA
ncbi:MAG: exonuclease SbcCD subunit D C-terminal domain-containing protein [Planctomycetes bacterium]|nr:exonuclease SbcCD subunit D C-terminal domain-containing protein [Planctomycetota bacterium]